MPLPARRPKHRRTDVISEKEAAVSHCKTFTIRDTRDSNAMFSHIGASTIYKVTKISQTAPLRVPTSSPHPSTFNSNLRLPVRVASGLDVPGFCKAAAGLPWGVSMTLITNSARNVSQIPNPRFRSHVHGNLIYGFCYKRVQSKYPR